MDAHLRTSNRWYWLLVPLVLLPHLFSSPKHDDRFAGTFQADTLSIEFGLPRVYSGDEPHYLLMLNSVLEDGDLDLKNNYESVHRGGIQAGTLYAGSALDHHVGWYLPNEYRTWPTVYTIKQVVPKGPDRWKIVQTDESIPPELLEREPPFHPSGMPLMLAAISWPLRGTEYIEPLVLVLAGLAVAAGGYFFLMLLEPFELSRGARVVAVAAVLFGTPLWHYGRTLFAEPFLMPCAVGGYAMLLRRNRPTIAGLLLAVGILIKPPLAVIAIPLAALLFKERKIGELLHFCVPVVAGAAINCGLNEWLNGGWLRAPYPWYWGNFGDQLWLMWLSGRHGIFAFSPILVVALLGWPRVLRVVPREGVTLLAGFALLMLLMAANIAGLGSFSYGPRQMVPVLPFLMVGLGGALSTNCCRFCLRTATAITLAVSITFNAIGSLPYWTSWNIHPAEFALAKAVILLKPPPPR